MSGAGSRDAVEQEGDWDRLWADEHESEDLDVVDDPNRLSPPYRAWMALEKPRGAWQLGTEVPFSGAEISGLATLADGVPLKPVYVGGLVTLVNHGLNNVLKELGIRPLPVPQARVRVLDYLAYDLLQPIVRPGEPSSRA